MNFSASYTTAKYPDVDVHYERYIVLHCDASRRGTFSNISIVPSPNEPVVTSLCLLYAVADIAAITF